MEHLDAYCNYDYYYYYSFRSADHFAWVFDDQNVRPTRICCIDCSWNYPLPSDEQEVNRTADWTWEVVEGEGIDSSVPEVDDCGGDEDDETVGHDDGVEAVPVDAMRVALMVEEDQEDNMVDASMMDDFLDDDCVNS